MALFINIGILSDPINTKPIILGIVLCLLNTFYQEIMSLFFTVSDKTLLTLANLISSISIAVLYSINPSLANKQLLWIVVGNVLFLVVITLLPKLSKLEKLKSLYLASLIIIAPLPALIGNVVNGSKNWITVGSVSVQPSEIGKLILILFLSSYLSNYDRNGGSWYDIKKLTIPLIVIVSYLGLLVYQKDLGSALVFFIICLAVVYSSTGKSVYTLLAVAVFILCLTQLISHFPHIQSRIEVLSNPWDYSQTTGYQLVEGFYSVSSGGLLGLGLCQGYPKFIPVNESDYIFAVVCEELGIIFAIGLLIIIFIMFFRGMKIAYFSNNRFTQSLCTGISVMIASQVLILVSGIFGIIPLTGITFPFLSYGGSSLLSMYVSLGFIHKVSNEY